MKSHLIKKLLKSQTNNINNNKNQNKNVFYEFTCLPGARRSLVAALQLKGTGREALLLLSFCLPQFLPDLWTIYGFRWQTQSLPRRSYIKTLIGFLAVAVQLPGGWLLTAETILLIQIKLHVLSRGESVKSRGRTIYIHIHKYICEGKRELRDDWQCRRYRNSYNKNMFWYHNSNITRAKIITLIILH